MIDDGNIIGGPFGSSIVDGTRRRGADAGIDDLIILDSAIEEEASINYRFYRPI
jgi:hypothetical protein